MTLNVEQEYDRNLGLDYEEIARTVIAQVLEEEGCPYEAEVSLLLVCDKEIHKINLEYRGIDRPTDVLSFPQLLFERPGDFSWAEENKADSFNPDSGELMLGDIIISLDKVAEQADRYNHNRKREYAFLIAHSMLHLLGYDHMTDEEASHMEARQSAILDHLNIRR